MTLKTVDKVIKDIEKGAQAPKYGPRRTIIDNYKERILQVTGTRPEWN